MNIKFPLTVIAVVLFFSIAIFLPDAANARNRSGGGRGRGSGGHSRGGPASSGGFSSRSSPQRAPSQRTTEHREPSRRQERDKRPEDRRDHRDEVRDDRRDYVDDRWDSHDHRGRRGFATGVAVGAAAGTNYVTRLSCEPTIVVDDGVTYYNCGSKWYTRSYNNGEVVYVIATKP